MIHVVLSRQVDFPQIAADVAADRAPTHVLLELARQTAVTFHTLEQPPYQLGFSNGRQGSAAGAIVEQITVGTTAPSVTHIDTLRSKLISRPPLWALARHAAAFAASDDTLFATGEDVGVPLAVACAGRRKSPPPRLVVTAHNINRPRARIAFRFFDTLSHVSAWLAPSPVQAAYLRSLGVPDEMVSVPPEQTDTRFFTPAFAPQTYPSAWGAPDRSRRPLIVSVGLEQRDYRTLAAATADMDVDVKISGFSRDAVALSSALPATLPPNMSRQFYEWPDLRELYRQANLVVVPLFPNRYVAGVNAMLEGLAVEKPVIITRTEGMGAYLEPPDAHGEICLPVPPQNPAALRSAIEHLLHTPTTARQLALQGRQWLLAHHTPQDWVRAIMDALVAAPQHSEL